MWFDMAILIASCLWVLAVWIYKLPRVVIQVSIVLALLIGGAALIDWFRNARLKNTRQIKHSSAIFNQSETSFGAYELVLLNENDKPVQSWDLTGKTAMVIGRRNRDEEVDVDLSDCEYSALVDVQHAVLNFCIDTWYVEDLGSQNGIQIKKADDGRCYQVAASRPCKIAAGDVIYIAKTKLLFT
jgi:FHA domain.